jgi:hypothetical protein
MFIATLFIIAKLWKQLRCPTTNEWIKKIKYEIRNMRLSYFRKMVELEIIMLSDINQS